MAVDWRLSAGLGMFAGFIVGMYTRDRISKEVEKEVEGIFSPGEEGTTGMPAFGMKVTSPYYPTQSYPGIDYPWLMITAPAPSQVTVDPDRLCLGSKCWPIARMTLVNANEIVATLYAKSFPVGLAHEAAKALYRAGYEMQAKAVERLSNGSGDWTKRVAHTKDCEAGTDVLPVAGVGQFRGTTPQYVPKRPDLKQAPRPIAPYARGAAKTPCPSGSVRDPKTGQCVFHVPGPVEPEPQEFKGAADSTLYTLSPYARAARQVPSNLKPMTFRPVSRASRAQPIQTPTRRVFELQPDPTEISPRPCPPRHVRDHRGQCMPIPPEVPAEAPPGVPPKPPYERTPSGPPSVAPRAGPSSPPRPVTRPYAGCPSGYERNDQGQCVKLRRFALRRRGTELSPSLAGYDWLVPGG